MSGTSQRLPVLAWYRMVMHRRVTPLYLVVAHVDLGCPARWHTTHHSDAPSCAQQPYKLLQCLTRRNTKGKWAPPGRHCWHFLRKQCWENQGKITLCHQNHPRMFWCWTQTHQGLSCQDSAHWAPENWTLVQRVWNDGSRMASG